MLPNVQSRELYPGPGHITEAGTFQKKRTVEGLWSLNVAVAYPPKGTVAEVWSH